MIARDIAAESYFYFLEVPGKIYEIGTFNVYYNVDKDKIITWFTYFKTLCSYYNYNQYQKFIYLSTLVLHFNIRDLPHC